MKTKAEKIVVLSNIILHKAERIKKLKLECGRQATKICVLNERIAELEADSILRNVLELRDEIKDLKAENKRLIEGQQAKHRAGS